MKLLQSFKTNKSKVLPPVIVVSFLVLAGTVSYLFSPLSPFTTKQSESTGKIVSYNAKPTHPPTGGPTPKSTGTPQSDVLGSQTRKITSQPTVTKAPTKNDTSQSTGGSTGSTGNSVQATSAPINTPIPQQSSPTPAQAQASQTLSVEVKTPDGTSSFTVDYSSGMNACDSLQKAKDSGKIKSVSFNDSYMSTLHSLYVSEINGFANNWTFTVNGSSPLGCSLSQPKPNDTIVWKFG